jgi:hypothetical protein
VVRADINISVDGSLTDWGVTPGSDYTPYAGINSWVEPQIGSNGYLGPGYGGQTFNVEAMYSTVANGKLSFAVITGLPPEGAYMTVDGQYWHYTPGDILIDFEPYYVPSSLTTPTGRFDFAIETTTYTSGSEFVHGGVGAQGAGALFSNVTPGLSSIKWTGVYDPSGVNYPNGVYYPVEIMRDANRNALGTLVSTPTQFNYSYWGNNHYVIEGSVPISAFVAPNTVGGLNALLSWSMRCGNDIGYVCQTVEFDQHETIPEPTSLLLLVGSVAAGMIRRRLK